MTAVDVDALDKLREAWAAGGWPAVDAMFAVQRALPSLLAEVRRGRALREAVEGLAAGAASAADLPVLKGDRFDAGVAATYRSYATRLRAAVAAVDGDR